MAARTDRSRGLTSAVMALMFCLSTTAGYAANSVKSDCDEISDLPAAKVGPASSLSIKLTDHGLTDSASDMKDPASDPAAEKVRSPRLADAADKALDSEADDSAATDTDVTVAVDELPETSLRLPGIAEKDLPRFRRQMYRTDI